MKHQKTLFNGWDISHGDYYDMRAGESGAFRKNLRKRQELKVWLMAGAGIFFILLFLFLAVK